MLKNAFLAAHQIPPRGVEKTTLTTPKTEIPASPGAKSGALNDKNNSNLAWLTKHWPGLPESTRKQIIETAKAALKSGGHTQ